MNHEPLDRLHLQQIAAAYAAGYRMARAELADDTKYYTYGHEIEMYTVEQGEKRDKRQ